MPLLLGASEQVRQRYLPPVAAGKATFSYGLSEREAGSDTAAMRCRGLSMPSSSMRAAPAFWLGRLVNGRVKQALLGTLSDKGELSD